MAFATEHDADSAVGAHPGVAGAVPRLASPIATEELNHLRNAVGCLMDWAVSQQLIARLAVADPTSAGDLGPDPVPVRSRPGPATARRGRRAAGQPQGRAARDDLPHDVRAVLRARAARRRGVRTAARRCRHDPGAARRPRRQIRQDPPRPARTADRRAARRAAPTTPRTTTRPGARSRCSRSSPRDRCIPAPPARCSTGS